MLDWITVIALILMGLVLITVELIFIPGTTVVGILGLILTVAGIYLSFEYFGNSVGWAVLLGASTVSLVTLFYSLRSGVWKKFSLKTKSKGKFNENLVNDLQVGEEGLTTSTLRPIGKAEFNNRQYEVKTIGNYLKTGTKVRIVKISANKIIVEPFN